MKKNTTIKYIAFILLNVSIVGMAISQEEWDLRQCVEHAIENSLSIQASEYNIQSALIDEKLSSQQKYPSLNGATGVNWNFGRTIDPTTNEFNTKTFFSNNFSLNSGVLLFNGSRIKNQVKQSRLNTKAATEDKKQTERDLSLDVAVAYLNILFAQENLENSYAQLDVSLKQLEQVDKLIDAGTRPRNDRLDLVAQVSAQEQQIINQKNALDIAMLNIKQLMNLDPAIDISIVPPREEIIVNSDLDQLSFQEVFENAYRNQPSIQASELRLKSAEMNIDIAKSGFLPSIGAGASLGTNYSNQGQKIDGFVDQRVYTDVYINEQVVSIGTDQSIPIVSKAGYFDQFTDNISYGFGVNVNIPLYNNYSTKANVEQAKIGVLNQKNFNEQIVHNLKTSVQQSLGDARAAKKALEASNNTENAQKAAFENAEKRYELGSINTYEYILAKNEYDSAKINAIIAKYDFLFKLKLLDFYQGFPLTLN